MAGQLYTVILIETNIIDYETKEEMNFMDGYLNLSSERRRLLCEQANERPNLPAASLEKDYWVCWILRELFSIPKWCENITFKGGTSLSKCWGLINRFSEDIDIVIDRKFLGFGGEKSPENALSREMFFGEVPEFDDVFRVVTEFQDAFNAS